MDDKPWITALSQARVTSELARQRFDVYAELVGKSPFDLIAHRDGLLYRVSVKSTMSQKLDRYRSYARMVLMEAWQSGRLRWS